jgi:hypothetical protein
MGSTMKITLDLLPEHYAIAEDLVKEFNKRSRRSFGSQASPEDFMTRVLERELQILYTRIKEERQSLRSRAKKDLPS